MKYTLGLDVGTNSLGWAIIKLDKDSKASAIEKIGSRIFSDGRNPKDKTTLAAHRRQKRHQRRRYDRILQRKELILNQLVRMQLFPENHTDQQELKKLDVLKIRALSADQKIKKHELGRVIYHLFLRRGFLSNRKGESAEDVKTKISDRINNLKEQLKENNLKTVGQYLNHRYQKGLSTKATVENDFHILRGLIENEFDQIFNEQKKHYKDITAEQIEKLKCLLFYQRPLKPIETGKCSIYPDENRTFNYVPSFEYYRFLAELYNLRYLDENYKTVTLTNDEIFKCFEKFKNDKKVTYTQVRKFLDRKSIQFTIEHTKNEFKI